MPGAGFEPARSCEQRFLRPLAYAIRLPGRALHPTRAPGRAADHLLVFFSPLLNVEYAGRTEPLDSTRPASKPSQPPLAVPNQL